MLLGPARLRGCDRFGEDDSACPLTIKRDHYARLHASETVRTLVGRSAGLVTDEIGVQKEYC